MAEAIPLFTGEDETRPDLFDQVEFESTFQQSLSASFDLSQLDSTVISIARQTTLRDAEEKGGTERPTNELNEMFKDQGITFERPMNLRAASLIADRRKDRANLQNVIDRGPQGGFYGIAKFGASLLPHALDPIDFAVGIAAGGLLSAATKGTRFGQAIGAGVKNRQGLQAFKYNAVEGALGNIAVEPLVMVANQQEFIDYGIEDAFINATAGAVGFAGIRFAGGKAVNLINRIPALKERSLRSSISSTGADKKIKSGEFVQQYLNEVSGSQEKLAKGKSTYEFRPLDDLSVQDRRLYVPLREPSNSLSGVSTTKAITDDLGDGVYITDNPNVANGVAASHFNESNGVIIEVAAKELRLLDLDGKIPNEIKGLARKELLGDFDTATGTVREAIDTIQNKIKNGELAEEVMEEVNSALKAAGFDGYRGVQARYMGTEMPPSNQLMVFPESMKKIKQTSQFDSDPKKVPGLSQEKIKDLQDEYADPARSNFDYDTELRAEMQQQATIQHARTPKEVEIRKAEDTLLEEVEALERQELLTADDKKLFDQIKEAKSKSEDIDIATKAALICMSRS